jgi:AraC family transcriptional regulator of adaptative response/methylated-DNA-[protein]-cysteine methyltransferase
MIDTQLDRVRRAVGCELVPGESPVFAQLRAELAEYFDGRRREFTVPLHVPGTPFQMKVWAELQRIPIGTTTSYARLAESIGQPNAVRAVARANGDNRIAIIIPCHRVIGADGTLTGYGGGLWRKRWLLDLEGRDFEG